MCGDAGASAAIATLGTANTAKIKEFNSLFIFIMIPFLKIKKQQLYNPSCWA